jgi:transposase
VATSHLIEHKHSARKGRPTPTTPIKSLDWHIQAQVGPEQKGMEERKPQGACCVIGSHMKAKQLSDPEVSAASKAQAQAEGGLRFLTAPMFFVASLFVKKPSRIQGLLMVMTLALLVYAVVQRRLRQQWTRQNERLPNQINQPTERPTVRWVFQLLEGMHRVRVTVQGQVHDLIEGLNDVQIKILRLFGEAVCRLYQISPG